MPFYMLYPNKDMTDTSPQPSKDMNIMLDSSKQNIKNKKIYFDADGTEIKIGYDEEKGTGFVEIISE